MRKLVLYAGLILLVASGLTSCRSQKHCPAYDDTMEGYEAPKKKKRQEGLFPKKMRL